MTLEVRLDFGAHTVPRYYQTEEVLRVTLITQDADGDEFHLIVEPSDSGFIFSDSGGNELARLALWDARDN